MKSFLRKLNKLKVSKKVLHRKKKKIKDNELKNKRDGGERKAHSRFYSGLP